MNISLNDKASTHALFDLLLNTQFTSTLPTLLCANPFIGATLSQLRTTSAKVRVDDAEEHRLSVIGMILPHTLEKMVQMMEANQNGFKKFVK
jgi:hypothetical protein